MADIERDLGFSFGPKFFRQADEVMFSFGVDPNNVLGPRKATRRDQEEHAEAWSKFVASQPLSQLDHDGDGRPGGSLPYAGAPAGPPGAQPPTTPPPKNRGGRPRKNPDPSLR